MSPQNYFIEDRDGNKRQVSEQEFCAYRRTPATPMHPIDRPIDRPANPAPGRALAPAPVVPIERPGTPAPVSGGPEPTRRPAHATRARQVTEKPFHSKYLNIDNFFAMGDELGLKGDARLLFEHLYLASWQRAGYLPEDLAVLRKLAHTEMRQDKFNKTFSSISDLFEEREGRLCIPGVPEEFTAKKSKRRG